MSRPNLTIPSLSEKQITRFWASVDKRSVNECWPWVGNEFCKDYGRFTAYRRHFPAHRLALHLHTGLWPDLMAIHSCDNPPCCNPSHLAWKTQLENMIDKVNKGRAIFPGPTIPLRGSRHPNAKLNEGIIAEIRTDYDGGMTSLVKLGRKYKIDHTTVWDIVHRQSWTHVD